MLIYWKQARINSLMYFWRTIKKEESTEKWVKSICRRFFCYSDVRVDRRSTVFLRFWSFNWFDKLLTKYNTSCIEKASKKSYILFVILYNTEFTIYNFKVIDDLFLINNWNVFNFTYHILNKNLFILLNEKCSLYLDF